MKIENISNPTRLPLIASAKESTPKAIVDWSQRGWATGVVAGRIEEAAKAGYPLSIPACRDLITQKFHFCDDAVEKGIVKAAIGRAEISAELSEWYRMEGLDQLTS